jgi:hypothetical protein
MFASLIVNTAVVDMENVKTVVRGLHKMLYQPELGGSGGPKYFSYFT